MAFSLVWGQPREKALGTRLVTWLSPSEGVEQDFTSAIFFCTIDCLQQFQRWKHDSIQPLSVILCLMLQPVVGILALDTAGDWAVVFMLRSVTQCLFLYEYYTQMWKLGPKNLGANCDELASIQTLGVVIPPNTNSHFMLHKPKVLAYDDELFDSAFDSLFLYFRIL